MLARMDVSGYGVEDDFISILEVWHLRLRWDVAQLLFLNFESPGPRTSPLSDVTAKIRV
jgi:hypothetical protein